MFALYNLRKNNFVFALASVHRYPVGRVNNSCEPSSLFLFWTENIFFQMTYLYQTMERRFWLILARRHSMRNLPRVPWSSTWGMEKHTLCTSALRLLKALTLTEPSRTLGRAQGTIYTLILKFTILSPISKLEEASGFTVMQMIQTLVTLEIAEKPDM